jgi:YggT family protein
MIILEALVGTLLSIINLYIWVVIIAALITWVNPDPANPIVQILRRLTEPVYRKMREFFPTSFNGMDFAPIILILILQFLSRILIRLF